MNYMDRRVAFVALTVIWCWCSFQSTDAGHGAAPPRTAPHRTGCSGANPPADLTLSMRWTGGESGRQMGSVMADGRRERETELQGHGTENEEKEMIQRGFFRKTA